MITTTDNDTAILTGTEPTGFDPHTHHYEVVFHNETDHPLMLVAACHGSADEWDAAPPSSVASGETVTFTVGSCRPSAGGVVIYRDVVRGGLVTFCGNAGSRPGASCAFATPTDGLIAVGPQGYMVGTHANVRAEYVLG